jgi:hypothetical protein
MRREIRDTRSEVRDPRRHSGLGSQVSSLGICYSAFADLPIKTAIASGTEAPS